MLQQYVAYHCKDNYYKQCDINHRVCNICKVIYLTVSRLEVEVFCKENLYNRLSQQVHVFE